MALREKNCAAVGIFGLVVLGVGVVGVVQAGGPGSAGQYLQWLGVDLHRRLFPEQNPEGPVYADTANGPVALARIVRDARAAWPEQSVAVVHRAVLEVATGLLHRRDIEVGGFAGKPFVASPLKPWDASERIGAELGARKEWYDDGTRYVFRRK